MRNAISLTIAALLVAGMATRAHASFNLVNSIMSTKPWVRASIISPTNRHPKLAGTAGLGFKLANKTSGTLQYRVILGYPNQAEIGVTRELP